MKLTEEQKKKLVDQLLKEMQDRACELCGAKKWEVTDTVFELREFHASSTLVVGGRVVPVIPMTCVRCSNTRLLNAVRLGLIVGIETKESGADK